MSIIRSEGKLGPAVRKLLGVYCANVTEANTMLNGQLANLIGTRRSPMHKTLEVKPVFPFLFNSYWSTTMLPDHLVTGMIKNILVCFASLETSSTGRAISQPFCKYVYSSWLPSIDTILVWSRVDSPLYKTLQCGVFSLSYCFSHTYSTVLQKFSVHKQINN